MVTVIFIVILSGAIKLFQRLAELKNKGIGAHLFHINVMKGLTVIKMMMMSEEMREGTKSANSCNI
jgi:hypothetical protein